MWFRNLRLYRLPAGGSIETSALNEAMQQYSTRPTSGHEAKHLGWTTPGGRKSQLLAHEAQGQHLITMQRQERILPGAVVKEEVEARAEAVEEAEGRKVSRKEKTLLKEQVYEEFLPRAFIRTHRIDAWWDMPAGLIAINTTSAARADELLDLLRATLGGLKVVPLSTQSLPVRVMTEWLANPGSRPSWLEVGDLVKLQSRGDDGKITARNVDLDSDEIREHLDCGRQAVEVRIRVSESLTMTLADDLALKSLAFSNALIEEADQTDDGDDPVARVEADFFLMAHALKEVIATLVSGLGGETVYQPAEANEPEPAWRASIGDSSDDPLLTEARAFVVEAQRASVSALQRHFKIGYNRAAQLIEELELLDVVSAADASGQRAALPQ